MSGPVISVGLEPTDRPLIVVYGSGGRRYREYLLRGAAAQHPLWLLSGTEPTWQRPFLAGYTVVDTLDDEQARRAVADLAQRFTVGGIWCYDEVRLIQAARVATALGLPTSPADAVLACRDKHLSRLRLAAGSVPSAESICVPDLDEAERAAARVGYPVIVKPRGLAGSEGVGLVRTSADLPAAVAAALRADFVEVPRFRDGLLVEEYLDGPEISVDAVIRGGEVWPLFVAHKRLDPRGTFEETGHLVSAHEPLLRDKTLRDLLHDAHAALGFTHGMTHTEIRLTTDGPRIVEVNGRLGGDFIPYLGWLATGVDPALVAAAVALDVEVDLSPRRQAVAAVRFLYPDEDVTLAGVDVDVEALPPGIWDVTALAEPGARLLLPPRSYVAARAAAAFAIGPDDRACQQTLDRVSSAVRVRGEMVVPGEPS